MRAAMPLVGQVTGACRKAPEFAAPASLAAPLDFSLVATRRDFDALETDWNALFERAGRGIHVFQTYGWLWHWARHFLSDEPGAGPRLSILTARRAGRLVLVWPLVAERHGPLTKLSWMGEPVSQYGDVLMEDGPEAREVMKSSWRYITERLGADVIHLRKVRADATIASLLAETNAVALARLKAPYIDLHDPATFEGYLALSSSSMRKNRRRQRRRFEELGTAGAEFHQSGERAAHLARAAVDLKRAWLAERALLSPSIADDRTRSFFADACEARNRPACCDVRALTSNGKPAALELSLAAKGHRAVHIISYDHAFEKTAAGAILMEESINRAYADGEDIYDLLAPGDAYKSDWCNKSVDVCDWSIALTLKGRAYSHVYLNVVRGGAKSLIGRLPLAWRRGIVRAASLLLGMPDGSHDVA